MRRPEHGQHHRVAWSVGVFDTPAARLSFENVKRQVLVVLVTERRRTFSLLPLPRSRRIAPHRTARQLRRDSQRARSRTAATAAAATEKPSVARHSSLSHSPLPATCTHRSAQTAGGDSRRCRKSLAPVSSAAHADVMVSFLRIVSNSRPTSVSKQDATRRRRQPVTAR